MKTVFFLLLFLISCSSQTETIEMPEDPIAMEPSQQPISQPQNQIEAIREAPAEEKPNLSFDLPPEDAQPMDFDAAGPFFHTVMKAASNDGLTFQKQGTVLEHASVPDVLRLNDRRIALYAVDGSGRSKSGVLVALSDDNGNTWQSGSLQLESEKPRFGIADPEVVMLPDGNIRIYYVIFPEPHNQEGINEVWSALSSDGIHFKEEKGIRFKYQRLTDPDVVKMKDTWFMYFSQGPRLVAASSKDGKTFIPGKTIREKGSVSKTVPIDNNNWRQYYCNEGIKTALSSDGSNWRDEPGTRVTADPGTIICDPAPIETEEGWLLFYKVGPLPR